MWESLRNILTAYAAHDPVMGYVQSMNFIAAFLLLAGLAEEDAFWCLVALVDEVLPGYFSEGMAAAKLDQRVFSRLLHIHLPPVGLHLESLAPDNIVCGIISSQWLLTLFVNVLPTEATMRVWDRVFATRSRAPLFASCLALLQPRAADVLDSAEMGEAIELLQGLGDAMAPDEVDAFVARVDAYLDGEIAPECLQRETARERGRHRRPSDAGLPSCTLAVPPVTEVDELIVGLTSDLSDVISARALAKLDADAAAAARWDGSSGGADGDWELTDGPQQIGTGWAGGGVGAEVNVMGEFFAGAGEDHSDGLLAELAAVQCMASESVLQDAQGPHGGRSPDASPVGAGDGHAGGLLGVAALDPNPLASRAIDVARSPSGSRSGGGGEAVTGNDGHHKSGGAQDEVSTSIGLSAADVVLVSEKILGLDRRLRALPSHRDEFKRAVKTSAMRPLSAVHSSRLEPLRSVFGRAETEFRLLMQRALALGGKGLSWKTGGGVAMSGLPPGGPLWNAWADSLFEHVILRADGLLETLERISKELHWIVDIVRGQSPRTSTGSLTSNGRLAGEERVNGGGPTSLFATSPDAESAGSLAAGRSPGAPENALDQWEDVASSLPPMERSPRGSMTPGSPSGDGWARTVGGAQVGASNNWRSQPVLPPDGMLLTEVSGMHTSRLSEELSELIQLVAACSAAAAADLPVLESNIQRARAELEREMHARATALSDWSTAAEARRQRKTAATLESLKTATGAAAAAFSTDQSPNDASASSFAAGPGPLLDIDASTPPPPTRAAPPSSPLDLDDVFAAELARLEAATAAVTAATKALDRRRAAVERERAAASEVRARAGEGRVEVMGRIARLDRVASAVGESLRERASPTLVAETTALADDVAGLSDQAIRLWAEQLDRWARFVRNATAAVAMGYVTVVDAAVQTMHDLAEQISGQVAARTPSRVSGEFAGAGEGLGSGGGTVSRRSSAGEDAGGVGAVGENGVGLGSSLTGSPGAAVVVKSGSAGVPTLSGTKGLKEQSKQALQSLAGNLGSNMAKLQDAWQGHLSGASAIGSWASRFNRGGDRGQSKQDTKETAAAVGKEKEMASCGSEGKPPPSPATGGRPPTGPQQQQEMHLHLTRHASSPPNLGAQLAAAMEGGGEGKQALTHKESRQTQLARADLRRLEERRVELMARKKWLRDLLVATSPPAQGRPAPFSGQGQVASPVPPPPSSMPAPVDSLI